jgi:hypothetical protein
MMDTSTTSTDTSTSTSTSTSTRVIDGLNRYSVITMTDFDEIPHDNIITDNFGYRFTTDELGDLIHSTPFHPYVRTPWKNVLFSGVNIPIGLYFDHGSSPSPIPVIERPATPIEAISQTSDLSPVMSQWRTWANQTSGYYY